MTEQLFFMIVFLTTMVGIVAVVYLDRRRPNSDLREIHQALQQILANTEKIDSSLHDQRRALNDAYKQISAVPKRVQNPPDKPTEINGRISRSGRVNRCGLWYTWVAVKESITKRSYSALYV